MSKRIAMTAAAIALLAGAGCGAGTDDAKAARGMEFAIQDDAVFVYQSYYRDRNRAFRIARSMGVTRLRINAQWSYLIGPAAEATTRPGDLRYGWELIDSAIDAAARYGIRVQLALTGPAPAFATSNRRAGPVRPDPVQFADFARNAARHFQGRVDRFSIWNEPNWGGWISPLREGPRIYRALYKAGYDAIKAVNPRAQVLIGELAPSRQRNRATAPLAFLRSMLCVNRSYRSGRCGRFKADGFAHHPYDFLSSPTRRPRNRDDVTIGTLSRLTTALDRLRSSRVLTAARGSGRLPIHLTEYGYFSSGHRRRSSGPRWLAQGFEIARKNPRVKSMLQYLLISPPRGSDTAYFDLGLLTTRLRRHPTYNSLVRWSRTALRRRYIKRPGGRLRLTPARPSV
jgi:hypothetical protein